MEILIHLDVAYRVARRFLRDDHDAQDAVQDALLRAIRYFRRVPRDERTRVAAGDRAQHVPHAPPA
jgi:DNA-directed RNA polymerase specialized sigma24 family protein